jgi:EmrB/QacA subfamily drug resistance transporter
MAEPDAKLDPRVIRLIAAILVGGIAVLFDSTIVSIAVDTLATDLDTTLPTIQWVSTGYLLALALTIPLAVWAQSRIGGKNLWLVGLVLFLVGSIAASLSPTIGWLIAARALQGIGGGILMPLMSTLPVQAVGGKVTGKMIATIGLPAVLGPVLGPLVGGAVLHWLSWRWMFWINVPLLAVGFVLALRWVPDDGARRSTRLDALGAVLLPLGLVGLLYGLSQVSEDHGFGHPQVLVPLLAGAALMVAFVVHAVRAGGDALVDVRLLRLKSVGSSSAALFVVGASTLGTMLLLPLFWQQLRGATPLVAGLMMVPQGVGTLLSRTIAGRLTDTIGARTVTVVAFLVVGLTTVPFAFAEPTTSTGWLVAVLVVRGFGLGGVTLPVMAVSFRDTTPAQVPHASVITRIAQQVGGAFGTAVLAVVLDSAIRIAGDPAAGFHQAFWWATGFTALALVACLWLPGRRSAERASDEPATTTRSDEPAAAAAAGATGEPAAVPSDESAALAAEA